MIRENVADKLLRVAGVDKPGVLKTDGGVSANEGAPELKDDDEAVKVSKEVVLKESGPFSDSIAWHVDLVPAKIEAMPTNANTDAKEFVSLFWFVKFW